MDTNTAIAMIIPWIMVSVTTYTELKTNKTAYSALCYILAWFASLAFTQPL